MRVNREISLGNIVSWIAILIGFSVTFTKLQGDTAAAREMAKEAVIKGHMTQQDISQLKVDVAKAAEYTKAVNDKLDLLIAMTRSRQQHAR